MEGVGTAGYRLKEGHIVVGGLHTAAGPEEMCIDFAEELLTLENLVY